MNPYGKNYGMLLAVILIDPSDTRGILLGPQYIEVQALRFLDLFSRKHKSLCVDALIDRERVQYKPR